MRAFAAFLAALLLLLALAASFAQAHNTVQLKPYRPGDKFKIECKDPVTKKWGHSLICVDSNAELTFEFEVNQIWRCPWFIKSPEEYNFAAKVITLEDAWTCRVPIAPNATIHFPVYLPLWGFVEPTHFHVNYHMNFVFHTYQGFIVGATAYPVRDRVQIAQPGTVINMHGLVRYFPGHSYDSSPGVSFAFASPSDSVLLYVIIAVLTTVLACALYYNFVLHPRLVKRYLKSD